MQYQNKCKFSFEIPENFVEKRVKKRPNLKYDMCLSDKDNEIRYSFFDKEMSSIQVYNSFNRLNLWNLTQFDSTATIFEICENDSLTTKLINSDYSKHITFDIKSKYGKGFQYCTMICIHKQGIANLYITILYNDFDNKNTLFENAVKSINFKKDD